MTHRWRMGHSHRIDPINLSNPHRQMESGIVVDFLLYCKDTYYSDDTQICLSLVDMSDYTDNQASLKNYTQVQAHS